MLMGFIHNRQHVNLGEKNAPTEGRLSGQGSDKTPFGDEERMSVTKTYIPACLKSVTGLTSRAAEVGLLITCAAWTWPISCTPLGMLQSALR